MSSSPSFEKVAECLYRNSSSGSYYALVKVRGKQIKRSLEVDNLPEARRKLKDFRRDIVRLDPHAGRITLKQLADKFEPTAQHLARDTRANKARVLRRVREAWPEGADRQLSKIKPSEARQFLSRYAGVPGYNLALEVVRSMFKLAIDDGIIARSPVEGLVYRKREKPIRTTPSMEEFRDIVKSMRGQKYSDTADESADFIEFLGLAGLGQAEAPSLRWQDVNFAGGKITTFRHKTQKGFSVPLFPQLWPLLEKRLKLTTAQSDGDPAPGSKVFAVADAKKALASACSVLACRTIPVVHFVECSSQLQSKEA